jgi:nucleoside-diphosphate-sugar epimerase
MKTIFVTGGTGAVGTPLVRAMLARGDRVLLLARDPARAAAMFDHHPGLVVFAGDVLYPLGGIPRSEIARWRGQVDTFVHGAAIIQFHWGMLEQTRAVNIQGTAHMLELSEELAVRRFFHVSTAYVGGTCDALAENEWGDPRHAENPYELTKQTAEQLVAQGSPDRNHILRLSIVIGDGNTGVTAGFDGYYGFVQSIWVHRKRLASLRHHPLLVGVNPDTTLNLVTAEWVTESMLAAVDVATLPVRVVHLTHPQPVVMRWLFPFTFTEFFDIPVECDPARASVSPPSARVEQVRRRALQRALDGAVKYFGHYVQKEPRFGFENATRFLGRPPPPPVDEAVLRRVLSFARMRNFGRAVQETAPSSSRRLASAEAVNDWDAPVETKRAG